MSESRNDDTLTKPNNRTIIIIAALVLVGVLVVVVFSGSGDKPGNPQIGALPINAITRLGKGSMNMARFSTEGDLLALTSNIGVYVHQMGTLEELWAYATTVPVTSASFSPDDSLLAVGLEDSTTLLLDAQTGERLHSFTGPLDVTTLIWAAGDANRRLLIIGYNDGTLALKSVTGGVDDLLSSSVFHFAEETSGVTAAAISPDQRVLATGNRSGAVTLWDLQEGGPVATLVGHEENNRVLSIVWTADGDELISGGNDSTVIVWDVANAEPRLTLTDHTKAVVNVHTGPGDDALTSVGAEGTEIVWDRASGERQQAREGLPALTSAAWSASNGSLVLVSQAGGVSVLQVDDTEAVPLPGFPDRDALSGPIAWSPDGSQIAASQGEDVVLWDVETSTPTARMESEASTVTALSWSPDGTQLAAGNRDGGIRIWNSSRGRARVSEASHDDAVSALAWSPGGLRLASAGSLDGTVKIWHPVSGELLQTLNVGEGGVFSLTWSPDGSMLAAGTLQAQTFLFDASGESVAAEPYARFAGHISWITSLAFSPDNTLLAIGSADTNISVWTIADFEKQQTFAGHTSAVRDIAFSPDGTRLAAGALDKRVTVWDICAGDCSDPNMQIFSGHSDGVTTVVWSPDGKSLASGSSDGTSIIWLVASE